MITGTVLTESEILFVKGCLSEGIKNLNRILCKWIEESKQKGSYIKISIVDIRGVATGEIKKCLRNTIDSRSLDSIFRSTALFIDVDMSSGFVKSISFGETDTWRHSYKISRQINTILKSIKYDDLVYNSNNYRFIDEIQVTFDQNFNPLITFDYGVLNRIQF